MGYSNDIFKIKSNNILPQKGRILIAEPFLQGDYFNRSVVLLVSHSDKGAVGFILNKRIDFTLQEAFPGFPDFDADVFLGGPVSTDSIHYIHKLGQNIPGSLHVVGDVYWSGDFEVIKRKISLGEIHSSEIRFFVGYSGWDAGQLENEIKENSWLVTDISPQDVMDDLSPDSWFSFVKKAGSRYAVWKNFPQNPTLN